MTHFPLTFADNGATSGLGRLSEMETASAIGGCQTRGQHQAKELVRDVGNLRGKELVRDQDNSQRRLSGGQWGGEADPEALKEVLLLLGEGFRIPFLRLVPLLEAA